MMFQKRFRKICLPDICAENQLVQKPHWLSVIPGEIIRSLDLVWSNVFQAGLWTVWYLI